jgi:hypothetical protein
MSQENVEVVRGHTGAYDGEEIATVLQLVDDLAALAPSDRASAAVAAIVAQDPRWQAIDPDVVWDATGLGFSSPARGIEELVAYWRDWAGLWESYVFHVLEYRDLGDWVLTVTDVRARGRNGIELDMRSYQVWRVRKGRIVTMRACTTESDALATVETAEIGD